LFGKLFHVDLAEKILVLVNSCIVVAWKLNLGAR
jgi:hypothetical protein